MNYFNFKSWLISESEKDIFGFEKTKKYQNHINNIIVDSVNPDIIVKQLLGMKIGNKTPKSEFNNQIVWSNETNDKLKLEISPYGSLRATIKRLTTDSEGESVWVTKYVHLLPDDDEKINELDFAFKIFEKLKNIEKLEIDSNTKKIDFEKLVIKIAENIKLKKPCQWMIFNRVKKIKDNYYIIMMNMTGNGLESSSGSGPSNKIEQYHVNIVFNDKSGVIRSFGSAIESSKKSAQWQSGVPDWDENFITSQKSEEIISCITNSLKSF